MPEFIHVELSSLIKPLMPELLMGNIISQFLLLICVWDKVSWNPAWPLTLYRPEDDLELMIFRPPLSQVLGLQALISILEKERKLKKILFKTEVVS